MSEGTNKDQDWIAAPSPADVATVKPPRARVEDAVDPEESARATMERKRDYLEGFLQKKPEGLPAGAPGGDLYEAVVAALKEIFDPEIPVNIYELGLIYDVSVDVDGKASIRMTLTTPMCPAAELLPPEVETKARGVAGVTHVDLDLVWDPPWNPEMMSEAAKLDLGMV